MSYLPILTFDDGDLIIDTIDRLIIINKFRFHPQELYSELKEIWYDRVEMIAYEFPMLAIDKWTYELVAGWRIKDLELLKFPDPDLVDGIVTHYTVKQEHYDG